MLLSPDPKGQLGPTPTPTQFSGTSRGFVSSGRAGATLSWAERRTGLPRRSGVESDPTLIGGARSGGPRAGVAWTDGHPGPGSGRAEPRSSVLRPVATEAGDARVGAKSQFSFHPRLGGLRRRQTAQTGRREGQECGRRAGRSQQSAASRGRRPERAPPARLEVQAAEAAPGAERRVRARRGGGRHGRCRSRGGACASDPARKGGGPARPGPARRQPGPTPP